MICQQNQIKNISKGAGGSRVNASGKSLLIIHDFIMSYRAHADFTGIFMVCKRDSFRNDLAPIFTARAVATAGTKRRLHSVLTRPRTFLQVDTRHVAILGENQQNTPLMRIREYVKGGEFMFQNDGTK